MRTFIGSYQEEDGILVCKVRAETYIDALEKAIRALNTRSKWPVIEENVQIEEDKNESKNSYR
jgi:hypothetical protein